MALFDEYLPPLVKRLPANTKGRDLFVTDVHGCFSLLESMLKKAGFDERVDRLLIGGDLVDRGPESARVLDWLERDYVTAVRGNHEQFCIDSARDGISKVHAENGGEWFKEIDSALRQKIGDKFSELPIALEVNAQDGRKFGFVHGECIYQDWTNFIKGLENSADEWEQAHLMMESMVRRTRCKTRDDSVISGVDLLFVGHTSVRNKTVLGNVVYLDTGACFEGGRMTLIDVNSGKVWSSKPRPGLSLEA